MDILYAGPFQIPAATRNTRIPDFRPARKALDIPPTGPMRRQHLPTTPMVNMPDLAAQAALFLTRPDTLGMRQSHTSQYCPDGVH